jgi:hypothetical protein
MAKHHWSGWPGAFCLKCGSEDPAEAALADGWDPEDEPTPEMIAAGVCPVEGELIWNNETKEWNLVKESSS